LFSEKGEMKMNTTEVEKQIGQREREFSIAQEEFERASAAVRATRGTVLEATLSEKRRVLDEKRAALEAAWARRGDPGPGQPAKVLSGAGRTAPGTLVPSLMDRFVAASPDNREIEMRVRSLEHELDLLNSQIPPLERAFKAAEEKLGRFIHSEPTNDEDGRRASENFSTLLTMDRQKANAISAELAPLRARLAKVQIELETARTKRDEMLAKFTATGARK
jgi:hypothetical protein